MHLILNRLSRVGSAEAAYSWIKGVVMASHIVICSKCDLHRQAAASTPRALSGGKHEGKRGCNA